MLYVSELVREYLAGAERRLDPKAISSYMDLDLQNQETIPRAPSRVRHEMVNMVVPENRAVPCRAVTHSDSVLGDFLDEPVVIDPG